MMQQTTGMSSASTNESPRRHDGCLPMLLPEPILAVLKKEEEKKGEGEAKGGGNLSGPSLVCSIIHFSYVKLPLLNMTEAWTAHGVIPKILIREGRGDKCTNN